MNDMENKAYVFSRIFMLANRLQALGDRMDATITVKQWLLIAIILRSGGSPTLGEIAERSGNSRQNTKKMAVILQKQGFLELKPDLQDRRILRVAVTDRCQDYFRSREDRELQFMEQLFSGIDPEMLDAVREGISRLMANVAIMEQADLKEKPDEEETE